MAGTMTFGGKDTGRCETSWTTLQDYEKFPTGGLNWNVGLLKSSRGTTASARYSWWSPPSTSST
ncbi:hypothetical protein AAVH_43775, partial [Aphelenchoides avenae]